MDRPKYIAVDFDDTIFIRDSWRNYEGKVNMQVVNLISELHDRGWKIILWTSRNGVVLDEAVKFCKDNNIHLDYVNENPEAIAYFKNVLGFKHSGWSAKVFADVYLDDSAFNPSILGVNEDNPRSDFIRMLEEFCEKRHSLKVESITK